MRTAIPLSLLALVGVVQAQAVTVDYPDSTLNAPQGQYPIYTGTMTNVIRGQLFCPPTFGELPTTRMVCTKVGVQLSNTAAYAQFVVRFGTTQLTTLSNTWNTNLPDQRVQVDLSGQTLSGGTGANVWVEFDLAYPVLYTPGDAFVLDITSQAAAAGVYCSTAIGTGVARMISTNYTGTPTATPSTSGGIKFRMVFEPLGPVVIHGTGCPGTGNFTPQMSSMGSSNIGGGPFMLHLNGALGGAPTALVIGAQPTHLPMGGGCTLYVNPVVTIGLSASGLGAGQGAAAFPIVIPNNPFLVGYSLPTQWLQLDLASGAVMPLTTSAAGMVVVH
jgi:hypothetical protein